VPTARLNGEPRQLPLGSTVEDVVAMLSPTRSGIAVALNGSVVTRSTWSSTEVEEGDELEVLTAAQGG
jgi:sulfur carrier protein